MKIDDYSKYYIQGSDHYLIPKDVFLELFNEMINWREEAQKLENQLEVGEQQYNDLVEEYNETKGVLDEISINVWFRR